MATSDIRKGPLYVDSTNNSVGIGTTTNNQSSSTTSVTLNAASGMSAYELRNADVFSGYVGNTGTNMYLVNAKNGSLGLYTNNTERMHLTSTGNVGIGGSPTSKLSVVSGTNAGITVNDGTVNTILFNTSSANGSVGTTTNHPMAFYANNAERMRIDSSGNVGINTTTTLGAKLFVSQGAAASPATSGNMTTGAVIGSSPAGEALNVGTDADGVWYNAAYANNAGVARIHRWLTGGTERMRIDASGNVLLGTTSLNGLGGLSYSNADEYLFFNRTTSSGVYIYFRQNGTQTGYISHNATTTSYSTTSDYRLKTAVAYDWDATSRLKQLKPARFAWIADGDDAVPVDGFLAHEVQDVVPEAITGTKDEVDEDGNPVMQGIDQSKLVPLLCKTILELEARITALEAN